MASQTRLVVVTALMTYGLTVDVTCWTGKKYGSRWALACEI